MESCIIKNLFNSGERIHTLRLNMIINRSLLEARKKAKDKKTIDPVVFYNEFKSNLVSTLCPFKIRYDPNEKNYQQWKIARDDLFDTIKLLFSEKYKIPNTNDILKEIGDSLDTDFGSMRGKKIDYKLQEIEEGQESAEEESKLPFNRNELINKIYGNNFGAKRSLYNIFSSSIFRVAFVDFDKGEKITYNRHLNIEIIHYKNKQYKILANFLRKQYPDINFEENLYDDKGKLTSFYNRAFDKMNVWLNDKYENEQLSDIIDNGYEKHLRHMSLHQEEDSEELEAINAYIILQQFDDLLSQQLGKVIKVNSVWHNIEVDINKNKYEFSKDTSNQYKNWYDSEDRTAAQNSTKYTKFILSCIPLINEGRETERTIDMQLFCDTFSKLFLLTGKISGKDAKSRKLRELLIMFHSSPTQYAQELFDHICGDPKRFLEIQKIIKGINPYFNEDNFGVLESLYKYIFYYNQNIRSERYETVIGKDEKAKTVRVIEYNQNKQEKGLGKYSIVSDIIGAIDDCVDATYYYIKYGYDGFAELVRRKKGKDRHIAESFKDRANGYVANLSISQREELLESCRIDWTNKTNSQEAKLTIPISWKGESINWTFYVRGRGSILEQTTDSATIILESEHDKNWDKNREDVGESIFKRIYEIFGRDSKIDLTNSNTRERLLRIKEEKESDLSNEQKQEFYDLNLMHDFIEFIDSRLGSTFLTDDGLRILAMYATQYYKNNNTGCYIIEAFKYAIKGQIISDVYKEFQEQKYSDDPKKTNNFYTFLKNHVRFRSFMTSIEDKEHVYFVNTLMAKQLRVIPQSTQWVDDYAQAYEILFGDTSNGTSKNQSGTNDANYMTPFLGAQIHNVIYSAQDAQEKRRQEQEKNQTIPDLASSALLFTQCPNLVIQHVICADTKNRQQTVKLIRDLKYSELYFSSIIHDFWQGWISDEHSVLIQPTTYSDKVKMIKYQIDINKEIDGVKLKNATPDQIIDWYANTIGRASYLALKNVVYTLRKILGNDKLRIDQINQILHTMTEEDLVTMAQKVGEEVQLDLHYRIKNINGKKVLSFNETLEYNAEAYNPEILKERFNRERINFINELIKSNTSFYTIYHDTSLFDNEFYERDFIENLRLSKSPVAQVIIGYFTKGSELDKRALNDYVDNWIDKTTGKLILAKDSQGNRITKQTIDVAQMNPLLEKYFYFDSLLGNNLRLQLTGFQTNHPDLSNFTRMWDEKAKEVDVIPGTILEKSKNIEELQKAQVFILDPSINKESYQGRGVINFDELRKQNSAITLVDVVRSANGKKVITTDKTVIDTRSKEYKAVFLKSSNSQQRVNFIKTFNIEDLSLKDIMALNDDFDLTAMSNSQNVKLREIAKKLTSVIDNVAQGTQSKRNLIIPATLHYYHSDMLSGTARNVKVAVIEDMPASVFNFKGQHGKIKSQDGAAFVNPFQNVLENKSLMSQEVGDDKKPIWHHYNHNTGTASLMKFAAFGITNERIRASMNSTVSLLNIMKKMTNMQWQRKEDGEWNTSYPIRLDQTVNFSGINRKQRLVNFRTEILNGNELVYKRLGRNNDYEFRKITNFRYDENKNCYYTVEQNVDEFGNAIGEQFKAYHVFTDEESKHETRSEDNLPIDGYHTINSLYELWLAMGGAYSQQMNLQTKKYEMSENSNYAVVGFMNSVMFYRGEREEDQGILDQNFYVQPLKEMHIGYLSNNTTMKEGAANRNSVERWTDDKQLTYMIMDSSGSGIQMDNDHDVEFDSTMTEYSQVILALEAGGYLHSYARQVYYDLGEFAVTSSKVELDAVAEYIAGEDGDYDRVKSELYEVIGHTILLGIKSRQDQASLVDSILKNIEHHFHHNISHMDDKLKLPFSESNLYSQVLPCIAGLVNKKSIKRKYPGAGCVMVPSYNIIQYFQLDDKQYVFSDMVRKARAYYKEHPEIDAPVIDTDDVHTYDRELVKAYLKKKQEEQPLLDNADEFIPSDIVDVIVNGNVYSIKLDTLDDYYALKDKNFNKLGIVVNDGDIIQYRRNVTLTKNLAPARIKFKEKNSNRWRNIFDIPAIRQTWENGQSQADNKTVQQAFNNLYAGFYIDKNNNKIEITDLDNEAAEMIMPNIYKSKIKTGNRTIAEIIELGSEAFKEKYTRPRRSKNYDVIFSANDEKESIYISFIKPSGKYGRHERIYYDRKKLYTVEENGYYNVYLMTDDNRRLFRVGRYVVDTNYTVKDENGKQVIYKIGKDGKEDQPIKSNGFKIQNKTVYRYVEFVKKYRVREKIVDDNNQETYVFYNKYFIDQDAVKEVLTDVKKEEEYKLTSIFIASTIDDIYESKQFNGVVINPELSYTQAYNINRFINGNTSNSGMRKINSDYKEVVLNPLFKKIQEYVRDKGEDIKDKKAGVTIIAPVSDSLNIKEDLEKNMNNWLDRLAQQRYVSWQQSLYFTGARIPAQTLQSFMQEKVIAYTEKSNNIVYVSHFQLWLQGSDLDIDKSYIMGQDFGEDGVMIKYSNLFSFQSLDTLKASLRLPTPRRLRVNFDNNNPGYNVTEHLKKFANVGDNYAKKIEIVAELLNDIYAQVDRKHLKNGINLTYSNIDERIVKEVSAMIWTHEGTNIPSSLKEASLRNSISAKIQTIIQDLRNMNLAYSPVEMQDLREGADNSEKGNMIANMSYMNPLTKYQMQVQNMVGKKVIGIAAVGEKVFFTLSYYFNEGLRSEDETWIKRMQFNKKFSRIQGRSTGIPEEVTKTILANTNFVGYEQMQAKFLNAIDLDNKLRLQFNISENDIKNHTNNWELYKKALEESLDNVKDPVDLLISQILSAATDNAKELILAKINAGENLVKCHLYLIMLGFNIKDVIAFMTSPAVSLINDLTEANMFDPFINEMKMKDAIAIARGEIDCSKFIIGKSKSQNEVTGDYDYVSNNSSYVSNFNKLKDTLIKLFNKPDIPEEQKIKINNISNLVKYYIKARINGDIKDAPLVDSDFMSKVGGETRTQIYRLNDYVESIVDHIKTTCEKYKTGDFKTDYQAYLDDLSEFEKINEYADEMSRLGNVFLKLNQGLPTDETDLLSHINKIKRAINEREEKFGIHKIKLEDKKSEDKYNNLIDLLYDNNNFLEKGEIDRTLKLAYAFDMIHNFNFEYWLYDKQLTADDIREDCTFLGGDIKNEIIQILNNGSISYRELIADYYNIIKATYNIFDVIHKVPQYNKILDLYKMVYTVNKSVSVKSGLVSEITDRVREHIFKIDEKQQKAIIKYVDDMLISRFFQELAGRKEQFFPIGRGEEFFDPFYRSQETIANRRLDLTIPNERASFKKAFETAIIQLRKDGTYMGQKVIEHPEENALLQDLQIGYDNGVPKLKTGINLMQILMSENTQIKFQKYLNGFKDLQKAYINGVSVADWLMLYNLFTHQNLFGADRLTTVFKNYTTGSILDDYFKFIGEIDFNKHTEDQLTALGFDIEDVYARIAPFVSEWQELQLNTPYIKRRQKDGTTVLKKYNYKLKKYKIVSTFLDKDLLDATFQDDAIDQKNNYAMYQMLPMKNNDSKNGPLQALVSNNVDSLAYALRTYVRKGKIIIFKAC